MKSFEAADRSAADREDTAPDTPKTSGTPGTLPALLDSLAVGAYLVDEHGCIIAVNSGGRRLLARSDETLLGRDAHDLLHRNRHGETVARSQCPLRQTVLAGDAGQGGGLWFARGDGSVTPVSWLVTPYREADRTGTLVLFHDSSEPAAGSGDERAPGALSELERLALLAELTTRLTSTMDIDEALHSLVRLLLPRLADWAVIDLIMERDEVWRSVVVHAENGDLVYREDLQGPMPPVPQRSPMPLSRALRGTAAALAGPGTYQGPPDSGIAVEQHRLFAATGIHSAAIAPIRGLREVRGALTLGRAERPQAFTETDLPLLEDVTRRAGIALDNARLYQRQRKVAETMQRHLLPQLPYVPDLEMTVRYLSAPDASQVGGDWYDAFTLARGATALVIGDVVGHDLEAAAGMAQLRNMLRAYAHSQQEPPSKIVEWLEAAAMHLADVDMATLVFARITPGDNGTWELAWTNAGHPPPLLISHDGMTRFLTDGHGMLLGTGTLRPRPNASTLLPPGSTLLFYTDGLIEEPRRLLDEGLTRLRRHAAALAHRPLESFTDELIARTRPTHNEDDAAVLALRTPL